jgi:hypothetical protein
LYKDIKVLQKQKKEKRNLENYFRFDLRADLASLRFAVVAVDLAGY